MKALQKTCGLPALAMTIAFVALARPSLAHPGPHHDIERVSKLIEEKPDDVELLIQRAHFYRLDSQFNSALNDLTRARQLADSRPDVRFHIGLVYSDMEQPADAEKELTAAIQNGLKTSRSHAARARARRSLGKTEGAIEDFSIAIEMEPDVEMFMERGALQVQMGRLKDAEVGYRDGLKRLGNATVLAQALIDVESRLGHFDEALRLIDEQLRRSRLKVDWLLLRAEILEKTGRKDEASSVRNEALADVNQALSRRQIGVHLVSRARVNLALGRLTEARSDVMLALNKSPKYPAAQELLVKIDSTEKACLPIPAKQGSVR